jgi:predicted acylesterase/phospholipase RssA
MHESISSHRPIAHGRAPYVDAPTRVVVTFEGGGASGIGHVGALREIEAAQRGSRADDYTSWPRYQPKGFSGTSSGAVIAAVAAVGCRAEQIFPRTRRPHARPQGLAPMVLVSLSGIWGLADPKRGPPKCVAHVHHAGLRRATREVRLSHAALFLYRPLASLFATALLWIVLAGALTAAAIRYPRSFCSRTSWSLSPLGSHSSTQAIRRPLSLIRPPRFVKPARHCHDPRTRLCCSCRT